jgi:hypothetical protein
MILVSEAPGLRCFSVVVPKHIGDHRCLLLYVGKIVPDCRGFWGLMVVDSHIFHLLGIGFLEEQKAKQIVSRNPPVSKALLVEVEYTRVKITQESEPVQICIASHSGNRSLGRATSRGFPNLTTITTVFDYKTPL